MPPRGRKQSPFVGRRSSLVDDSGPLLYRRYSNTSQIVEGYVRAQASDEAAARTENGAAAERARRQAAVSLSGQPCKPRDADIRSSGKLHRSKKRSIEDDGASGQTSGRASGPEEDAKPGSKGSAGGDQAAYKSRRRDSEAEAHAESPTVQAPDGEAARRRKRRAAGTESGEEVVKKKKKKLKKGVVSSAGTSACAGDGEFTNAVDAEAAAAENEETKAAAEVASQKRKSKKKAEKMKRTETEAEARNGEGDEGREAGAPGEVARKVAMEREVAGIEVSQAGGNRQEAMTFRERLGIKQGDMASASTKVPFSFGFGEPLERQEARGGRGESTADEEAAAKTEQEEWWLRKPRRGGAGGGAGLPSGEESDGQGYVRQRVYVGGMPFHWEEEEVAEFWSYCGEIQDLQLMRFPDTQRFKGIAFITFATEEAYQAALACDGDEAEGRFLVVSKCRAPALRQPHQRRRDRQTQPTSEAAEACPPQHTETGAEGKRERPEYDAPAGKVDGYNVAYVGNIPWELDAEAVTQLFDGYNVQLVRLHTDKDTGKSKGFAHVHFQDAESMERALALDGTSLLGRKIKVAYGQPKAADGNDRQQPAEGAAGRRQKGASTRQGKVRRAGQGGRSNT